MGKKLSHEVNVRVEGGVCKGTMVIHHGSLKHTSESQGLEVRWTCNVDGVPLTDLLQEAARNISVRMAGIREFEYAELVTKRDELDGSTINYKDIGTWTTRGQKGRRKIEDLSPEELIGKMTEEQKQALLAMLMGK